MIKVNYSVNFITHTVQPGDSLNKLAKQYDSAVSSILAANPTINPNYIYCGQRICVPVRTPFNNVATYQQNHNTQTSGSLYKILESMKEVTKLLNQSTELVNDINIKLTEKYTSIGEEEEVKTPLEVPEKTTIDVSGKWDTTWGDMILIQTGKNVSGSYTWDNGKIEGVLNGNIMTGTWSEEPTYNPPRDAGKIEFTFNHNTFLGKWGYGDEPLSGAWVGTRI